MMPDDATAEPRKILALPHLIMQGTHTNALLIVLMQAVGELLAEKRGLAPDEIIGKMFAEAERVSKEEFDSLGK